MPRHLVPALYDLMLAPVERLGLRKLRQTLVHRAEGCALEIGVGTGLNLPHYRNVDLLVAVDRDWNLLSRARRQVVRAACPVALVVADAQHLPFRDEVFDAAIATFVFCSVAEPVSGFGELRRVLRRRGELHLLEHVRGNSSGVVDLQRRLTPFWRRVAGGCHLNRDTVSNAIKAEFVVRRLDSFLHGLLIEATMRASF